MRTWRNILYIFICLFVQAGGLVCLNMCVCGSLSVCVRLYVTKEGM